MDFPQHSNFLRYHRFLTPRSFAIQPRRIEYKDFGSVTIMELIESLQEFVEQNLSLLAPVEQAWQPTNFLPDLTAEDWVERLNRFRIPPGSCPTSCSSFWWGIWSRKRRSRIMRSRSNMSPGTQAVRTTPLGRGSRGWTAEENRHGDLLNAYLRLTGRVDMRSVERTVHHLIRNGFSSGAEGTTGRHDLHGVSGTCDPDLPRQRLRLAAGRAMKTSPAFAARSRVTKRVMKRSTRGWSAR